VKIVSEFVTGRNLPVVVIGAGRSVWPPPRTWSSGSCRFWSWRPASCRGPRCGPGAGAVVSPWRYDIDRAARRLLDVAGWAAPHPQALPTGGELAEQYLEPLAKLPQIAPHVRHGTAVQAISRQGVDRLRTRGREQAPFVVRLADGTDVLARAVIDASGTWRTPNTLGVNGLPAHGEPEAGGYVTQALSDVLGADRESKRPCTSEGEGEVLRRKTRTVSDPSTSRKISPRSWPYREDSPPKRPPAARFPL
jgi:hypothetical protein